MSSIYVLSFKKTTIILFDTRYGFLYLLQAFVIWRLHFDTNLFVGLYSLPGILSPDYQRFLVRESIGCRADASQNFICFHRDWRSSAAC